MASSSSSSGDGSRSSRAASSRPFIGHSSEEVPAHGLASGTDVLKVIAYLREQPKSKKRTVSSMSCDLDHISSFMSLKPTYWFPRAPDVTCLVFCLFKVSRVKLSRSKTQNISFLCL